MEMWKTAALPMEKPFTPLMEKDRPFPQDGKPLSHSAARLGRLPTVPQCLRLLLPQKSRSLIEKIIISW